MNQALEMPTYVHDKIINALYPLGISPHEDGGDVLIYKLEYENGLALSIGIVCVQIKKLIIFKEYAIGIIVHEINESRNIRERHLTGFVPFPKSEYDITFDVSFLAKFTSMTRAVANTLKAGECITTTGGDS
tara:strand:+ start:299 stop:694 length:396 start_codon:yes stop_codon:yes gene_type:complete